MVRFYNSLQFRLTVSFILLILLITGLTYFSTYNEAKKALKETVREELTEVIGVASTQMKGDILSRKNRGDTQWGIFSRAISQ